MDTELEKYVDYVWNVSCISWEKKTDVKWGENVYKETETAKFFQ